MGYFGGWGRVQKLFWGLLIWTSIFCFKSIALFVPYHVVLSWWWWVVVVLMVSSDNFAQPNYIFGCFVLGVVVVVGL